MACICWYYVGHNKQDVNMYCARQFFLPFSVPLDSYCLCDTCRISSPTTSKYPPYDLALPKITAFKVCMLVLDSREEFSQVQEAAGNRKLVVACTYVCSLAGL